MRGKIIIDLNCYQHFTSNPFPTIFPAIPDAPSRLKPDDIDEHAVSLSWEKPKSDGGKRIEGYVIEYKEPEGTRWKAANDVPVTQTKFTGREF